MFFSYFRTYLVISICFSLCIFELNGSKDEHHFYDKCFTWRDDLDEVTLTCRVQNFSTPVMLYHHKTNTKVTCFIDETESYCIPKDKTFDIDHSNRTVTIVLVEEKEDRNLDGTWYCKQGGSILTTDVSVAKGIVMDSWVKIQGRAILSENGKSYIDVECSSCRKPQGLITEFFVNGITIASVYQDDQGNCLHKSLLCSANVCNCTSTGNMFSLRLHITDYNTTTEFACEMVFSDTLRNGRFYKTAFMNYTTSGFVTKEPIAKILKKNANIPTQNGEQTKKPVDISTPLSQSDDSSIYISVNVVCSVLVIVVITFVVYKCLQRRKYKQYDGLDNGNTKPKLSKKCVICSKRITPKRPGHMCFGCRQYFCSKCSKLFHNANEEVRQHKSIEMEQIPEQFTIEVFNCQKVEHNKAIVQYLCQSHNELWCSKCRTNSHEQTCIIEKIDEISPDRVDKIISDHQVDLDVTEEALISLKHFIKRLHDSFKRNYVLCEEIEFLNDAKCQAQENDVITGGLSKNDLMNKLKIPVSELLYETGAVMKTVDSWHAEIRNQKNVLDFIMKKGEQRQIIIAAVSFSKILDNIKLKIKEAKCKFEGKHIHLKQEYGRVEISILNKNMHSVYTLQHEKHKSKAEEAPKTNLEVQDQTESQATKTAKQTECQLSHPMAQVIKPGKEIQENIELLSVNETVVV